MIIHIGFTIFRFSTGAVALLHWHSDSWFVDLLARNLFQRHHRRLVHAIPSSWLSIIGSRHCRRFRNSLLTLGLHLQQFVGPCSPTWWFSGVPPRVICVFQRRLYLCCCSVRLLGLHIVITDCWMHYLFALHSSIVNGHCRRVLVD